jgi:Transposase C of IS166 homeodomain
MPPTASAALDDIDALRAALAIAEQARREAEARASGAEAMVTHLKLLIAKLKHDRFGASSERSRKLLDQMELELEELEAAASEDAILTARRHIPPAIWQPGRACCNPTPMPGSTISRPRTGCPGR